MNIEKKEHGKIDLCSGFKRGDILYAVDQQGRVKICDLYQINSLGTQNRITLNMISVETEEEKETGHLILNLTKTFKVGTTLYFKVRGSGNALEFCEVYGEDSQELLGVPSLKLRKWNSEKLICAFVGEWKSGA